jgi:NTE family protein
MDVELRSRRKPIRKPQRHGRPPFDRIALLLQGGGALGAYQAGVYQGLAEAGIEPDWIAGISIGAINAAIIAGNPPEARIAKLRDFWETVTADPRGDWKIDPAKQVFGGEKAAATSASPQAPLVEAYADFWRTGLESAMSAFTGLRRLYEPRGGLARQVQNQWNAWLSAGFGAPGFFAPRPVNPWLEPEGALEATSYYDTSALEGTLERLVDFDLLNDGETHFSVGAVNVRTGNFVYFDNGTHRIGPKHIMASGALPPGFAAIEIEGEHYWDGGLVSNTPLQWVLESAEREDTLAFQVDLWNARGAMPDSMAEVMTRQKEIQYSSRTRASTDRFKLEQSLRHALGEVLADMPDSLRDTPEYRLLAPYADRKVYNIIQLIYRSRDHELGSKDFEFSRASMEDHWVAGRQDTVRTLRHPEVLKRAHGVDGVFTFDVAHQGRE